MSKNQKASDYAKKHKISVRNPIIIFLRNVETHGFDHTKCWAWKGGGKGNGYGNLNVKGKNITAHRRSYSLFCGDIPAGMDVCHACDNRWCVNPEHLFVGTRSENMADCKTKGRTAGGNRKHLTAWQVQEVMRRLNAGVPRSLIAENMDISYSTIGSIARGDSYATTQKEAR